MSSLLTFLSHLTLYSTNDQQRKRRRKGVIYDLSGVLIHIGAGANVGHYIAHIKDEVYVFHGSLAGVCA